MFLKRLEVNTKEVLMLALKINAKRHTDHPLLLSMWLILAPELLWEESKV
jgi:hypothetical protein